MFSAPLEILKKALEQRTFSTFDIIQTRLWDFLNVRKVPVFGRYLQVQMSKKATFRIQIKRFFHICFHEGVIPILFQGKINHRFSFAPFYIPVKHWMCRKEFFYA